MTLEEELLGGTIGTEGQTEGAADDRQRKQRVTEFKWGDSSRDEPSADRGTAELRGDDSPGSWGNSGRVFGVSGKQKAKPGRKSAAAKADDDAAIRERIRGRLEEQFTLFVMFAFMQIGNWRAQRYRKINAQLAEKVQEAYFIPDENAQQVANPASHCVVKHLPMAVVETVSDVFDPVTVVTTAWGIYQSANASEQRIVEDYTNSQRRVPNPIRRPLVPEHPDNQTDAMFGHTPSEALV